MGTFHTTPGTGRVERRSVTETLDSRDHTEAVEAQEVKVRITREWTLRELSFLYDKVDQRMKKELSIHRLPKKRKTDYSREGGGLPG